MSLSTGGFAFHDGHFFFFFVFCSCFMSLLMSSSDCCLLRHVILGDMGVCLYFLVLWCPFELHTSWWSLCGHFELLYCCLKSVVYVCLCRYFAWLRGNVPLSVFIFGVFMILMHPFMVVLWQCVIIFVFFFIAYFFCHLIWVILLIAVIVLHLLMVFFPVVLLLTFHCDMFVVISCRSSEPQSSFMFWPQ